jgi:hypothetical protein
VSRSYYLTLFGVLSARGLAEIFATRHGDEILAMAVIVYYADTAY